MTEQSHDNRPIFFSYSHDYEPNSNTAAKIWKNLPLDRGESLDIFPFMKVELPLKEMTAAEKLGLMEEIWADLAESSVAYSPPDWHGRVLEERIRQAESGEVGFTDWQTAKKQIRDRVS